MKIHQNLILIFSEEKTVCEKNIIFTKKLGLSIIHF